LAYDEPPVAGGGDTVVSVPSHGHRAGPRPVQTSCLHGGEYRARCYRSAAFNRVDDDWGRGGGL